MLTLWAAVVAVRLGFDVPTALTLGQAVAGSSARGVSVSMIEPRTELVASVATGWSRARNCVSTCSAEPSLWSARRRDYGACARATATANAAVTSPCSCSTISAISSAALLRPGNVHSAEGWRSVLEPVIARYRERGLPL